MKKLTAMLAILLALMLALPCALAEDSTMYSLSLLDPVFTQNGETALDLTGLNVDVVAMVTDGTEQALSLELYSGENYDYITSLQIQFAEEGIVLFLDGMSQSYCLSYDAIAELTGNEAVAPLMNSIAPMLKSLQLRSTVEACSAQAQEMLAGISAENLRWLPLMSKAGEIELDAEGKCVIPVHVDEAQGAQTMTNFDNFIQQASGDAVEPFPITGYSADGEITVYGSEDAYDRYTVELTGTISSKEEAEPLPYTLTAEVSDDDISGEFAVTESSGSISKMVISKTNTSEDPTVKEEYTLDLMEDDGYYASVIFQTAEDEGDWFIVTAIRYGEAEDGSEDSYFVVNFLSDFNADADHSWGFSAVNYGADETDPYSQVYLTYEGIDDSTSEGIPYRSGYVTMGVVDGDESYDLAFRVVEMRADQDTADWVIPFADSVDIASMSESDMSSAQMGLMGVFGEVVATLQEEYPFFESLFAQLGA